MWHSHEHSSPYTFITLATTYLHMSLEWRHNGHDGHPPHECLLNRLLRRKSKKTSKLRATGLCAGSSPVTGEFPARMASNAENISIWWRHHVIPARRIRLYGWRKYHCFNFFDMFSQGGCWSLLITRWVYWAIKLSSNPEKTTIMRCHQEMVKIFTNVQNTSYATMLPLIRW